MARRCLNNGTVPDGEKFFRQTESKFKIKALLRKAMKGVENGSELLDTVELLTKCLTIKAWEIPGKKKDIFRRHTECLSLF